MRYLALPLMFCVVFAQAQTASNSDTYPMPTLVEQSVTVDASKLPNYPEQAKRFGLSGQTLVQVTYNAEGKVQTAKITQSSGSRWLDKAALQAVRRAKIKVTDHSSMLAQAEIPVYFSTPR